MSTMGLFRYTAQNRQFWLKTLKSEINEINMFNSDWLKIKPAAGNHYYTEARF